MQPRRINSDFLKTAGAVLLIGAIVVATFLYGNSQRQQQVKRDQAAKKGIAVNQGTTSTTTPRGSSTPAPTKSPTVATGENKSAGQSQGVGGGGLPTSGGTTAPNTMPDTGSESAYLVPVGVILTLVYLNRAGKRNLHQAFLR